MRYWKRVAAYLEKIEKLPVTGSEYSAEYRQGVIKALEWALSNTETAPIAEPNPTPESKRPLKRLHKGKAAKKVKKVVSIKKAKVGRPKKAKKTAAKTSGWHPVPKPSQRKNAAA